MSKEKFEELVSAALDSLSEKFKKKLHNVAILIEDFSSKEQTKKMKLGNQYALLGLYEGVIQSRRLNYGPVLPDRITIFKEPILLSCGSENECRERIVNTVRHEIAHHFGSDEKGARKAGKHRT